MGMAHFYSDNNLAKYPKDEDNDPTKLRERELRDTNLYNEGLKIIDNALAGKYRRQLYHVENVGKGSVWFNFRQCSFVFLTVLSVTLHILAHRLLFVATGYLVATRADETRKISLEERWVCDVTPRTAAFNVSAVIDGIYCSLILTYGKIGSGSWVIASLSFSSGPIFISMLHID